MPDLLVKKKPKYSWEKILNLRTFLNANRYTYCDGRNSDSRDQMNTVHLQIIQTNKFLLILSIHLTHLTELSIIKREMNFSKYLHPFKEQTVKFLDACTLSHFKTISVFPFQLKVRSHGAICSTCDSSFIHAFCEIVHMVQWVWMRFAMYLHWNRTLKLHRIGMEPFHL